MHPKDVFRDLPIPLLIRVIRHDEEKIETRKEGIREGDVLVGILVYIILRMSMTQND